MRIALFGQADFGKDVFASLQEAGEQLVGVSVPRAGARPDALRVAAEAAGLPVIETPALREPGPLAALVAWQPDLLVFAFVTDIVRRPVLEAARLGAIQYHPSLLPRHRGRSAMAWPIIAGEPHTGLTIFWVDRGVDTGPILLQREVAIEPDDTVGSLYFQRLAPMGVAALTEAVRLVREGQAPRIPQDEASATYEPPIGAEHGNIDWQRPAIVVHNHIRGCDPQPGAATGWHGERLRLFDCICREGKSAATPGTVVAIEDGRALIATVGGAVSIGRVQSDGEAKVAAGSVLAPGDLLGPIEG